MGGCGAVWGPTQVAERLPGVQTTGADIQGPWDVAVRAFLRAQSASQT